MFYAIPTIEGGAVPDSCPGYFDFLSILSIKCGNWFYWAERAETADRAEMMESPLFMQIYAYLG